MEHFLKNNISLETFITLFSHAPNGLAMVNGPNMIIEVANEKILNFWGKTADVISLPLLEALPEIQDQEFPKLLQQVYETGIPYLGSAMLANIMEDGESTTKYFDFSYTPIFDDLQNVTGICVSATDVTEKVLSEKKLKESIFKFKELILNSEYCSAIYTGRDLVIELANDKMLQTWDKTESIIGLPLTEGVPSLVGQHFMDDMQKVFDSGENFIAKEDIALILRNGILETSYYNYTYQPIKNEEGEVYAIFNMAVEVTDMVLAKKSAVENFTKLQGFIENVPMAIAVFSGSEFILEMSNKDTNDLWGDLIPYYGLPIKEIFPEFQSTGVFDQFLKVFESGQQIEMREVKFLREGFNEDKYLTYILHPTKDENGKTLAVIAIAYDVTEDLKIRRNLSESEKKYKNLSEAIPQIIWTSDAEGRITYCNERLKFYLGEEIENPIGKQFYHLSHPQDLAQVETIFLQAITGKTNFEVEYRAFNNSTKNYVWLLTRVVPSFDEQGNVYEWIGTSTDINEFKLLQSQKDTFLGIASHELKTPLTSLKIYSQVLERVLRKSGDDKNAEYARKMDSQINKLNALISDLLDVTKISAGKMHFIESDFNFDELAQEMIEELRLDSDHQIIFNNNSGGMVFADKNRISQVMSNLISNAIKYSPGAQQIVVTTGRSEHEIQFHVEDFGIGMPDGIADKVFEQYYRVSGDDQHEFSGLGLGLYISADIIERSNGKIWVNSVLGKGSTFCFSLPLTEKL